MDYSVTANMEAVEKAKASKMTIENGNTNDNSLFTKGQQVTGTVIAVGEQVTLDFDGQQISAAKEVLPNAVPGEKKTFEVIKATKQVVELRLLEENTNLPRQSFQATYIKEDWDSILSQKEQNVKLTQNKEQKDLLLRDEKLCLEEISAMLTEKDSIRIEEEGFPIESYRINGLKKAIIRAKETETKQSKGQALVEKTKENPSKKQALTEKTKNNASYDETTLKQKLIEANLPATTDNLGKLSKALELSEAITKMDDKAMRYLISNSAEPTIETIYKAFYSGAGSRQEVTQLSEKAWQELSSQVEAIISEAGYEINNDNLQNAKWLIENQLPLTSETFAYKKELDRLKTDTSKSQVLDQMLEGMKQSISPKDVSLRVQTITPEQTIPPEQVVADVNSITEKTIEYAVSEKKELTIKGLLTIQQELAKIATAIENPSAKETVNVTARSKSGTYIITETAAALEVDTSETGLTKTVSTRTDLTKPELTRPNSTKMEYINSELTKDNFTETNSAETDYAMTDYLDIDNTKKDLAESDFTESESGQAKYQYEEVKAKRQLEELRLKMTVEAAAKLEKKGISVETEKLEKVVEALRELEDNYYKEMLREADAAITEENLQTLKATTESIERLRYVPTYVLGTTLSEQKTQTISSLLVQGTSLQNELTKAGADYETLMTVPSSEYGDSIKKAFANMSSLLSELNISNTEANQRAVRVLSYNQMPITEESVSRVKAYDLEVTTMMKNLHPAVTVRMIKEGMNPLNMPMEELNSTIDRMKEEQGITSEEKFSTYLQKLEKTEGITAEERKAYIGIYRLLYNVEKSDGAALGAVVKANQEVTLNNLLTAVMTGKKGRVDKIVNDKFGTLSSISYEKETIAQQLSSLRNNTTSLSEDGSSIMSEEDKSEAQTKYLNRILKQLKDEASPEKLKALEQLNKENAQVTRQITIGSTNQGNATLASNPLYSSGQEIWHAIGDIPADQLLEQLHTITSIEEGNATHTEKLQQIRELTKNSEQALRFLNEYRQPASIQNISIVNHILSNGESPIVKIIRKQQENIEQNVENSLKELNELSDTLIDKASMNELTERLDQDARVALTEACGEETIDQRRLAELKNISQQMTFLRTLAQKEFYQIPIETEGKVTNLNLTVLRNTGNSGNVAVSAWSEYLGNITASFTLQETSLKGYLGCDNKTGLKRLQESAEEISLAAKESAVELKQLDFVIKKKDNNPYQYQEVTGGEQSSTTVNNIERTLYRVAKAIVHTIRRAEQ